MTSRAYFMGQSDAPIFPDPGSVTANVFHSPISHFTHLTPYLPKHYTEEWVHDMRR